jgi:hypothetical protein
MLYGARFDEMMPRPIAGSVEIHADLQPRGVPLYGLTNFSAETYPLASTRCIASASERRGTIEERSSWQLRVEAHFAIVRCVS